eukprot:s112_g5.t1
MEQGNEAEEKRRKKDDSQGPKETGKDRLDTKPASQPLQDQQAHAPEFGELTAGQLVKHQTYLSAVKGLEEGQITEQAFLAMFSHKQRQGLFKLMESCRSPSQEPKWKELTGQGANMKKQSMLLAFIKGGLQKSLINTEHTVQQAWESTKTSAWVPWKQMVDEFGKEEAVIRLKAGLIRMRRDPEAWKKGLKLWQFLKMEESMKMGRSGNQAMTGCSSGVMTQEKAEKVERALKSVQANDDEFFDAAWLGKKPQNVQLEDWQLTESEELEIPSQHESEHDMELFLADLGVAGSSAPGKRKALPDVSPEACDKANKKAEACNKATKLSEACDKASKKAEACNKATKLPEACDKASKKAEACDKANEPNVNPKLQRFDQNVDKLSSCEMTEVKKNTRKMVSLLAAEIKNSTAATKKHSKHKGLKESLEKLQNVHKEVEKAVVDEKTEKAQLALLQKSAKVLKSHKRILMSAEGLEIKSKKNPNGKFCNLCRDRL